jgi:hypothetical protein
MILPPVPGVELRSTLEKAAWHLEISEDDVVDLLYDPAMAVQVIYGIWLDAFQSVRLKRYWFVPDVEDSSGYSSGKTAVGFLWINTRAVLIPDQVGMVVYPTFQQGKDNFWKYYRDFNCETFQSQLGKVDLAGDDEGKANTKEPACWKQYFLNGSEIRMPAPNFLQQSTTLAGLRTNTQLIDEYNKILGTEGGEVGVRKQILGRNTRASFNKNHPVWCNHVVKMSTAELSDHPSWEAHLRQVKQVERGNPNFAYETWNYKDYSNLPVKR